MPLIILGRSKCPLTGRVLQATDYIVCFPHFIHNRDDPLWRYSDSCMLREAFERWEFREVFLQQWRDFVRERYTAHIYWEILLDDHDHLVTWQKERERLEIIFLNYAFTISVLRKDWKALRDFFLNAIRPSEVRDHKCGGTYLLQVEPEGIRLIRKADWQDCIVLSQAEWEKFLEVLSILDREILPQL